MEKNNHLNLPYFCFILIFFSFAFVPLKSIPFQMRVLLLLTVVAAAASQFYGSRGVGRVSFAPVVTRPVQLVVQQRPSVIISNSVVSFGLF